MEWCTVHDVLPRSEFCVQSYFYPKSKNLKKLKKTLKPRKTYKNLKT